MNTIYFSPLSLSQLLKEKGIEVDSIGEWEVGGKLDGTNHIERLILKTGKPSFGAADSAYAYYNAYNLSELPDVFRQVFGDKEIQNSLLNDVNGRTKAQSEWEWFTKQYFKDPKKAWETLEKTIRELK